MSPAVTFSAVLRPHRSASLGAIHAVMALMAGFGLAVGAGFAALGAWPVFGFMGLDVALLYGALVIVHRRATTAYESIELTRRLLTVRRVYGLGRAREFAFNPYWLRIAIADGAGWASRVELRSHGCAVTIADFLSPPERLAFARDLGAAVARVAAR